jgi:hypothetical protein
MRLITPWDYLIIQAISACGQNALSIYIHAVDPIVKASPLNTVAHFRSGIYTVPAVLDVQGQWERQGYGYHR